jgi:SAM-dependent methyltransferase
MSTSLYRRAIRPHLPQFVFDAWRAGRRAYLRLGSVGDWVRLRRLVRELRVEFGGGFVATVAERDEVAMFLQRALSLSRPAADAEYLRSGRGMIRDVERLLDRLGRPLAQTGSLLEFACGYGRFTRFAVARLGAGRVTSSDIDPKAVAFVGQTFGVRTFDSVAEAADLAVDDRFDVIFVASLFSHLALPYWHAWAAKLMSLLNDGGLLVFSVHGPHALAGVDESVRGQLDQPAAGFTYGLMNETNGRLDGNYYGAAFVTDDFVREAFESRGLGRVIDGVPRGLWDYQDVYTVAKTHA